MQSGVFAFVIIDVDGNFLDQAQRPAVSGFEAFEVGGEEVVGLAGRNALGELAHVVGVDLPLRLLVFGGADFYEDAVDGMIVGSPNRAGDNSIVVLGLGRRGSAEIVGRAESRTELRKEDYDQEEENGGGQRGENL